MAENTEKMAVLLPEPVWFQSYSSSIVNIMQMTLQSIHPGRANLQTANWTPSTPSLPCWAEVLQSYPGVHASCVTAIPTSGSR